MPNSNNTQDCALRSPYIELSAEQWSRLRASTKLSINQEDLDNLRGLNVDLNLEEVGRIFLPLSRLLNSYVGASQELYRTSSSFLGELPAKVPFIIGIAGSVAVGKSTVARVIQRALAQWPNHPKVELITTDGFLYENAELLRRGILDRKGFPESYDRWSLLAFLDQVKSGVANVYAPQYSHLLYDIVPNASTVVSQPDILLVEGLTVLQTGDVDRSHPAFVSDYFDFSIYLDAQERDIRTWYIERFLKLRRSAFSNPASYFHKYSELSDEEAVRISTELWESINHPNLQENILPTRERADLILHKRANHAVDQVRLRRL